MLIYANYWYLADFDFIFNKRYVTAYLIFRQLQKKKKKKIYVVSTRDAKNKNLGSTGPSL